MKLSLLTCLVVCSIAQAQAAVNSTASSATSDVYADTKNHAAPSAPLATSGAPISGAPYSAVPASAASAVADSSAAVLAAPAVGAAGAVGVDATSAAAIGAGVGVKANGADVVVDAGGDAVGAGAAVSAEPEVWFNPALLSDDGGAVADLSAFQQGRQMPGTYLVDIYLNGEFMESRSLAFIARPEVGDGAVGGASSSKGAVSSSGGTIAASKVDDSGLVPDLTMRDLENFGVKMALLAPPGDEGRDEDDKPLFDPTQHVNLEAAIAASTTAFDFSHQRLDISIPQAAMDRRAIGEVPEYMWDEGVNAFLLSYNFTGSKNSGGDAGSDSNFLSLGSGLNLGAWRLRDQSTWNKTSGGSSVSGVNGKSGSDSNEWQHVSTTLSRAIIPLKSELVIGDSSTSSEVFDSVSFRGMQLASDDTMYPDSQQGYAPTVRGVAKSNAKVTIKQDATVLYQTYVSPGPFIIEDLFSTYDNGDLQVEIEEADGSITHYSVPYTSVPNMLREGRTQYGLTAGNYRSSNDEQNEPTFLQGSLVMGLSDGFTLFGGAQLSEDYRSVAMGVSKNLGDWGGVSADVTHAFTALPNGDDVTGQSLRLLYSKSLNDYGTDLELMSARYSTEEFYTFADSTYKSMSGFYTPDNVDPDSPDWAYQYDLNYAKQGRMEVNLSQQLQDAGSI